MTRPRFSAPGTPLRWVALAALTAGTCLAGAQEAGEARIGRQADSSEAPSEIKMEYKWKPGQFFHCRLTGGGTINMKVEGLPPGGGATPAGGVPMELQTTADMVQRVKELAPDGSAILTQQLESTSATNKVMGQQILAKFENGKFSMTMNGQPMQMPPGGLGDAMRLAGKPTGIKLTRRGQVLTLEGAAREAIAGMAQATNLGGVFGNNVPGAGMLVLPEGPVRIGQSWEDKQTVRLPISIPGPPGTAPPTLQGNYTAQNTLVKLESEGVQRVAVIGTKADTIVPETKLNLPADRQNPGAVVLPMIVRDFSRKVDGTLRFDLEAGVVLSGDYNVTTSMKMDLASGAAGGAVGGAKPQMIMDSILHVKVAVLPEGKAATSPANQ